ncbi:MAG: U32 family peptidase [Bacilli bacterium]|nr:U32 family peptidase [Bacilli bacterium]
MKLITKVDSKNYNEYKDLTDALIMPLANYAVGYKSYFMLEEIKEAKGLDLFVVINKNIFNDDIDELKEILKEIDKLNISGILFYDLSLIALKKELNLKTDLILDITHMMDNHDLVNYFSDLGINGVRLPSELTIDEIKSIKQESKIPIMVNYIGVEDVAFSKRKLLTNSNIKKDSTIIKEEISKEEFIVNESDLGTSFLKKEIFNASSALEELVEVNTDYIILNEDYIEHDKFVKILAKTKEVLDNKKNYSDYQKEIESLIGNYTGFLYKDMIYRVKGNEKD